MTGRTRRDFLGALGTACLGTVAGCRRRTVDGSPTTTFTERPPSTQGTTPGGTAIVGSPPMVQIDAGTYTIGTDSGPEDAQPAHEVSIESFRIDKYEVTNARFAAFLDDIDIRPVGDAPPGEVTAEQLRVEDVPRVLEGAEGEEQRPLVALDDDHSRIGIADGDFIVQDGFAAHPVNEVTWIGARRFARWRGARLPTEVEWEAAARGQAGRLYPWGDTPPTHDHAVYGQSSGDTAPVGTHREGATPRGIHDMAGNVSEWTSTLYRPYPYDGDDGREDPGVRGERVTRGGAHVFFSRKELRTYYRTGFSREYDRGHRHIGFRCVKPGSASS